MKWSKTRLLVACAAVAIAGWSLQVSAGIDYVSHWDFGSDALGAVDMTGNYDLVNSNGVTIIFR